MIFDLILGLIAVGALYTGFKNGLLTTILRSAFFIAGGVGAMYLVVEYDQSGWLIVAIIAGAYAAAGGKQAQFNKFMLEQIKNTNVPEAQKIMSQLQNPFSQKVQLLMGYSGE